MTAEQITLGLFLSGLILCVASGTDLIFALLFGVLCFGIYSIRKGNSPKATVLMMKEGMTKVANILIILVLIGCLTASWRFCGTIPFILYHSISFIQPRFFVLCTFLLCSMMSFLTGTSFGTFSTMGVICMLIGRTAGISTFLLGGAILSGSYFGDRCSPMSSSAQLVCSLTQTDIYGNIKRMMRSCLVPFILSAVLYTVFAGGSSVRPDTSSVAMFKECFSLHWIVSLPAILILVMSLLHIDVRWTMTTSILTSIVLALLLQKTNPAELFYSLYRGYAAPEGTELAKLLNGGGITSMLHVCIIVLISSSYSGIFSHTLLILPIKEVLIRQSKRLGTFGTVTFSALISCGISCNQSLGTLLTCQLCEDLYDNKEDLALALEDTVIVICALIPWGVAGAVPLATLGAPLTSMAVSFYLWLIPLWGIVIERWRRITGREKTIA